jgi:hypothetical protein
MLTGMRVRRAAISGLTFLAVRPIVEDVMQGVDVRLIIINLLGAAAFALMTYGWLWWWDKRAINRSIRARRP